LIKSFKEIAEELKESGFKPTPSDCIDGYEFEDWLINYCKHFGYPESNVGSCIDCCIENNELFKKCLERSRSITNK